MSIQKAGKSVVGKLGPAGGSVVLSQIENSFIEGWIDDTGDSFDFFNVYFGENCVSVSMGREAFAEIKNLFKEI